MLPRTCFVALNVSVQTHDPYIAIVYTVNYCTVSGTKVCKNNDERFNQFQWLTFFSTVIQLIIISIPPLSEDMIAGQYIVLRQIPSSCKRARSTHIPIYHDDMI